MIAKLISRKDKGLVNLETPDRELEDLIIREYQGKLFEEQHFVEGLGNAKLFKFFKLRIFYLLGFLEKYGKNYSYIVRRCSDNKIIMKREVVRFAYSPN
jgi:hypothetical protein